MPQVGRWFNRGTTGGGADQNVAPTAPLIVISESLAHSVDRCSAANTGPVGPQQGEGVQDHAATRPLILQPTAR